VVVTILHIVFSPNLDWKFVAYKIFLFPPEKRWYKRPTCKQVEDPLSVNLELTPDTGALNNLTRFKTIVILAVSIFHRLRLRRGSRFMSVTELTAAEFHFLHF
jgi:hypothetical protein